MKTLGHWVSNTGSINHCFAQTIASAWRSFWANVGRNAFKRFSLALKKKRLSTMVFPIISFRCTRWPWTKTRARRLDAVQRKMIYIVLGIQKYATESPSEFAIRKNRFVSREIGKEDKWSVLWAKRVVSWSEHVSRNTAGACWSSAIAHFRDAADLASRRAQNSSGRPQVRISAGFTSKRWYESAEECKAYMGPAN